ncbi:hypothetical protein FH609_002540 [Streptomyces sp. 3MP-14]|uniref:Uncharacterized protein n=1 Tax=Streptomyces mimosae TaxID=2586635 RepID=A0A5N6ACQ4_9ACTN|nr:MULTISPECIES: hypothetical protein [Streptomyces]KAB8166441.1 hypothetical protein FH607_011490 [Streptomyces mimosae]KAB8178870.1 hypothetical protein FH609_002540 [Streptomyces sp. 3MP-14]
MTDSKVAHLHLGSNIPGCLPENAPECFDSLDRAMDALSSELRFLQSDFHERCDGECGPDLNGTPCAWCDVAGDVDGALSCLADGDASDLLRRTGEIGWTFRPPEGPDVRVWCARIELGADACELARHLVA